MSEEPGKRIIYVDLIQDEKELDATLRRVLFWRRLHDRWTRFNVWFKGSAPGLFPPRHIHDDEE
jgi:hypothetical protein